MGNQRWKSTNEDFQKYLRLVRAGDKELYKKYKRKIEHRKLHTINLPVGTLMYGVSPH